MNIKTRSIATAAVAAVAGTLLSMPAAQADFAPAFDLKANQVDVETFRQNVVSEMSGKAFGWQLAIAQNGQLKVTDKRGTAISAQDNGGTKVDMQPTMKMELAIRAPQDGTVGAIHCTVGDLVQPGVSLLDFS